MLQRPHRSRHAAALSRCSSNAVLLGFIALLAAGFARGEEPGPPLVPPWVLNLGAAGLLAEYGAYDTYGIVQQRLGLSRAQIEWSRVPGNPTHGYEDSAEVLVVPVDLTVPLAGGGDHAYLRVGAVAMYNRGAPNLTRLNIDTQRMETQFLYIPTPDTLLALGAVAEDADVELRHNGGTIAGDGYGVRFDLVHKFAPVWGLAVRAEYLWCEGRTRVPLPNGVHYAFDQDYRRLYVQTCVVGTFSRGDLPWVPAGWVLQPSLGALFERNCFDETTDSFGRPVGGTVGPSDRYATVTASARLASMQFRPWRVAPYFELGIEREVCNDLNVMLDEPTIVRTAIGASLNLTHGARLDIEYARHDGVHGRRRDQSLTVHFGLLF